MSKEPKEKPGRNPSPEELRQRLIDQGIPQQAVDRLPYDRLRIVAGTLPELKDLKGGLRDRGLRDRGLRPLDYKHLKYTEIRKLAGE